MKNRGTVILDDYYAAVGHTSLTWTAVQIGKSYFVDGEHVTKLIKKTGYSAKRVQHLLKRIGYEISAYKQLEASLVGAERAQLNAKADRFSFGV